MIYCLFNILVFNVEKKHILRKHIEDFHMRIRVRKVYFFRNNNRTYKRTINIDMD